jgi:hypothetical protein
MQSPPGYDSGGLFIRPNCGISVEFSEKAQYIVVYRLTVKIIFGTISKY